MSDYNPFSDSTPSASSSSPTVTSAADPQTVAKNHFSDTSTQVVRKKKKEAAKQSSTLDDPAPVVSGPSTSSLLSSSGASTAELERLRAELREKESIIAAQRLEMQTAIKERDAAKSDQQREANFPRFYPICYLNIPADHPDPTMRKHIRVALTIWFWFAICLIWGFFCIMMPFFDAKLNPVLPSGYDNEFVAFFLCLIWMITGVPLSFYYWFYTLYEKHRKTGAVKTPSAGYWWWFFHAFINVLWCIVYTIGLPQTPGMPGFVVAIEFFQYSNDNDGASPNYKLFGTFCIINSFMWVMMTAMSIMHFLWIFRWYKAAGGRNVNAADIQKGIVSAAVEERTPILNA